jgi:hypothetical protein
MLQQQCESSKLCKTDALISRFNFSRVGTCKSIIDCVPSGDSGTKEKSEQGIVGWKGMGQKTRLYLPEMIACGEQQEISINEN